MFRGARGVVRSMWFAPTEAYEVEFTPEGLGAQMRAMLLADQIQVDEESRFNPAGVNQPVH